MTSKDLLVRLQSPRFLVERDEVVLSANVHNNLKRDKSVRVELIVPAGVFHAAGPKLPMPKGIYICWLRPVCPQAASTVSTGRCPSWAADSQR